MGIKAIYIGSEFYTESQMVMASMMFEDGTRFCLGDIEMELREGKTITIRPATDAELGLAHKMLKRIKRDNEERRARWAKEDAKGSGK